MRIGVMVPLVRTPRTLPRILQPVQVDALLGALRTWRDRAMAEAMVLGGLRRCEVLGLRLADLHVDRRPLRTLSGSHRSVSRSSRQIPRRADHSAVRPETLLDPQSLSDKVI